MGLYIKGTNKFYRRSYAGLHHVRWLAMLTLGAPETLNRHWMYGVELSHLEKLPSSKDMENLMQATLQAGYYYPNLFFHSDCDGKYTLRGKVLKNDRLLSGNLKGLHKELIRLKKNITSDLQNIYLEIFNELYDLVEDEVKNGKGELIFS